MTRNDRIGRDVARCGVPVITREGVQYLVALCPKEASKALGVSPTTVLRLLRSGELRGRKVGKLWRITPEAVAEYLHAGVR